MSFSGKDDGDHVPLESCLPFSFDKESVDLGRIAAFKPPELLGQHGVEGVGDHGHDNVEVHLGFAYRSILGLNLMLSSYERSRFSVPR